MSGDRQTENFSALDQTSRAAQAVEVETADEPIQSDEDLIASMRQQLRELEERDRANEARVAEANKLAAEEKQRRERAEDAARMADSRAVVATNTGQRTVEEARLGEITVALEARTGQMAALRQQYQAAFAEGDGGKMADINSQMALVGAQMTSLEAGKAQLEQRREVAAATPQITPDQARDQMLQGLNSRERDWVRSHPEYFDSPNFQRRVQAVSMYAQERKGFGRDSKEYIDFIDQELGFSKPEPAQTETRDDPPPPPTSRGRSADVADRRMITAPAGGSVPNVSRGTEEPVHLTRDERAFARSIGMSESDYARNKKELQQEGLIGPGAANRR